MGHGRAQALNQLKIAFEHCGDQASLTVGELHVQRLAIFYCITIGIVLLTKQFWART